MKMIMHKQYGPGRCLNVLYITLKSKNLTT
uniref:Uncharacterized protein n=1 Tax=Anguilla anguilla TaxID=7936 RepID=A0A0E9XJ84_ANGAN